MTPAELLFETSMIQEHYAELLDSVKHTELKYIYQKWKNALELYPELGEHAFTKLFRMEAILELHYQVETLKMQLNYVSEN
jgi:hypothetical protein